MRLGIVRLVERGLQLHFRVGTTIARRAAGAVLVAAALSLVPLRAGAAQFHPMLKVVKTHRGVGGIAMDGPLVAFDVSSSSKMRCNRMFAWNVKTGARKLVSGKGTCEAQSTSTGAGVVETAVAGRRIAWIVNLGGNTESEDYLYRSSWGKPKERRVATATRSGDDPSSLAGGWIRGLVGSDSVLAVNRWTTAANGHVTSASLRRIAGRGLRTIASGPDTRVAVVADSGRIAVLRSGGIVALYSQNGDLLRRITPSMPRAVGLSKKSLVVLTKANTLEVYRTSTGSLLHTWPVKGRWGPRRRVDPDLDVHKGVAVYSTWHSVHAVRLSSGRDVVLRRIGRDTKKRRRLVAGVEIEAPGVVYAFDTFHIRPPFETTGQVVFMPMAKVLARVR